MLQTRNAQENPDSRERRSPRGRVALTLTGVLFLVILAVGGYAWHWRWTGLSSNVHLWDWLQTLALPVALGAAPVLMRHRHRLSYRHVRTLFGFLLGFAVLVTVGYLVPLGWTGFEGNTLWNWLELLVLPLAVGTASLWLDFGPPRRGQKIALALALLAFIVLVACGYLVPWRWTGFSGNTAWDWVKLLLVPIVLPTVLQPAVVGRLNERLATREPEQHTRRTRH